MQQQANIQVITGAFVVIVVLMVLVFLVLAAGFIVLIVFIGKKMGAQRSKDMERYVEDWLAEDGYELVRISEEGVKDSPFAGRRPYRPGVVRAIKAKDRRGRVHRGWVFFPARPGARGYSGFRLEAMEVEWEE
jgi:hypothetical protein